MNILLKTLVDSHHHLWDLSLNKNRWLIDQIEDFHIGNYEKIRSSYGVNDFLHDAQEIPVKKSVHIQAGWDRTDSLGETQWLSKLSHQTNFPSAIVAYADLSDEKVETLLTAYTEFSQVRGIRQILNWHENSYYSGCNKNYIEIASWHKSFSLLKKYNLTFDMQIYPEQVDAIIPLLSRNDEVNVVIDHGLMPRQRDTEYLIFWERQLKKLSIFPNVYIKISGIAMFDHHWTVESFKRIIMPVISIFSPARCMIGSNFPVDKLYGSYKQLIEAYMEIIASYSDAEQKNILSAVAEKFYRI